MVADPPLPLRGARGHHLLDALGQRKTEVPLEALLKGINAARRAVEAAPLIEGVAVKGRSRDIRSPVNGDFIGTSEDGKLSLPSGPQIIGLENESVGFRDVRTVEVVGGKITPIAVTLPNGAISINTT